MTNDLLLRYGRHILLPEIDIAGQEKLAAASVLILGVGGLGSPVAMYLASAGVGKLILIDDDTVELSNLQRQIAHTTAALGKLKVDSAAALLNLLNPAVAVQTIAQRLRPEQLTAQVKTVDAVVDCSDNFPTRFALNAVCAHLGKPLISGAASRFEGQATVFIPSRPESPCYRCLYHEEGDALTGSCSENGVFAPLVGIIGSLQAAETLKILLGIGETLCGRLWLIDAKYMEWRTVKLRRDPQCPVCGGEKSCSNV